MKKTKNRKMHLDLPLRYIATIFIINIILVKINFFGIEDVLRTHMYISISIVCLLLILFFIFNIKEIKKNETNIGFIMYLVGYSLFTISFIFIFPQYIIQSSNYLLFNNHTIVSGELINKDSSSVTVAQWMTYTVKLENGEEKEFDYLIPTKRPMVGDIIQFKAGDKADWFEKRIIISIDKIEKK